MKNCNPTRELTKNENDSIRESQAIWKIECILDYKITVQ